MNNYENLTIGIWTSAIIALLSLVALFMHLYFVPVEVIFTKSSTTGFPLLKDIKGIMPRIFLTGIFFAALSFLSFCYKRRNRLY